MKRVGTKQNLDYELEHGLDCGLYYMNWTSGSIIDSSMDWTVKDYECWRDLFQDLHVDFYPFFITWIDISV